MTQTGLILAQRVRKSLAQAPIQDLEVTIDETVIFAPKKLCARNPKTEAIALPDMGLGMAERFTSYKAHLILGACGIAVRLIAPLIGHKSSDPAVLVMDSQGRFVISLLSGHLGGANRLAKLIACRMNATAVITTASDECTVPSLDLLFRKRHCTILDWDELPTIQAYLLEERRPLLYDPLDLFLDLPCTKIPMLDNLNLATLPCISLDIKKSAKKAGILRVLPPIVLGIGCKKKSDPACVFEAVALFLEKKAIDARALVALASVDEKANEPALRALAVKLGIPLRTQKAVTLAKIKTPNPSPAAGRRFATEDFSVCEAAACAVLKEYLGANWQATLLCTKERFFNQVTLAVSCPMAQES